VPLRRGKPGRKTFRQSRRRANRKLKPWGERTRLGKFLEIDLTADGDWGDCNRKRGRTEERNGRGMRPGEKEGERELTIRTREVYIRRFGERGLWEKGRKLGRGRRTERTLFHGSSPIVGNPRKRPTNTGSLEGKTIK